MSESLSRPLPDWHGTAEEKVELLQVLENNCNCTFDRGARTNVCKQHKILVEDQETLDRLLFFRNIAPRLRASESEVGKFVPSPELESFIGAVRRPTIDQIFKSGLNYALSNNGHVMAARARQLSPV